MKISSLSKYITARALMRGSIAFFIAISAFIPLARPAEAVVPVHCPIIPCRTWDIALSGEVLNPTTPVGWFVQKEYSAIAGGGSVLSIITSLTSGPSLDALLWEAARFILREFTENIVHWIKTGQDPFFFGGTNGGLFVTNIDEFVLDAADNAAGVFLSEYLGDAYDQLCSPFRLDVGLGLGHSYGRDYGSFKYQARCSITDIVANLEDFYNDFENGGWEAWFATSRYENTPLGLLTLSLETSIGRERRAASANILDFSAGLGFLGLRECPPENQIPGPTQDGEPLCKNNGYITKSPGKAVEDQLADALGQDVRQLEVADEIDEILALLFDELLAWALGGKGGGLLGYEKNSVPDFPESLNPDEVEASICSTPDNKPGGCACNDNLQCASGTCSFPVASFPSGICTTPTPPPDDGTPGGPQCDDDIDNDGDGHIDFPTDLQCTSAIDPSEAPPVPQCSDGIDNDGDNLVDTADPDCQSATDIAEDPRPLLMNECIDSEDNNGDGLEDFPDDPNCISYWDTSEIEPGEQG
jgi:hypothetical protein